MFHTLGYPDFRLYWFGMLGSVFGQNMQFVTLGWMVLQLTNSPLSLGIVGAAQAIPTIGFSLLGGALADRVDRSLMLRVTQSSAAALFFGLGTLVVLGLIEVW